MPTRPPVLRAAAVAAAFAAAAAAGVVPASAAGASPRPARDVDADVRFAGELARQGLWREAIARWERALADRPDDAKLLNNIAVAAEALGDFAKAREAYAKAATISNDKKIRANFDLFLRAHPDTAASPAEGK